MAYADTIRSSIATMEDVADLIEGIAVSGYPLAFSTWAPSYGAGGSMTFTSVSTTYARTVVIGKFRLIMFNFAGTTGGSASTYLTLTAPAAAASLGGDQINGVYVVNSGTATGRAHINTGSTTVQIFLPDTSNWGLGASRGAAGFLIYETG